MRARFWAKRAGRPCGAALVQRPRLLGSPSPSSQVFPELFAALGSLNPILLVHFDCATHSWQIYPPRFSHPRYSPSSQPNYNSTVRSATPVCSGRDFRHRSLLRRSGNPLSQDTRSTATTFTDYPLPPDTELNTKWHSTPQVPRSPHGCPPSGRALTPPMAYR